MYPAFLLSGLLASSAVFAFPSSLPVILEERESNSTAGNGTLIDQLLLAPTAVDRLALLPNNDDWLFDFNNPPGGGSTTTGLGMFSLLPKCPYS